MIYLGQPYSHPEPEVREARYQIALDVCAQMAVGGAVIYSPIVHWHPIHKKHDLPKNHNFWMAMDLPVLKRCDSMLVLMLEGWEESLGLRDELECAKTHYIPVMYMEPTDVLVE